MGGGRECGGIAAQPSRVGTHVPASVHSSHLGHHTSHVKMRNRGPCLACISSEHSASVAAPLAPRWQAATRCLRFALWQAQIDCSNDQTVHNSSLTGRMAQKQQALFAVSVGEAIVVQFHAYARQAVVSTLGAPARASRSPK